MDALMIPPSTAGERRGPSTDETRSASRSGHENAPKFAGRVAEPTPRSKPTTKAAEKASEDRTDADPGATVDVSRPVAPPVTTTWTIDPLAGPWLAAMPTADLASDAITTLPLVPDDGSQLTIIDPDLDPALAIIGDHQDAVLPAQLPVDPATLLTTAPDQVRDTTATSMAAPLVSDDEQLLAQGSPTRGSDMSAALLVTGEEGLIGPSDEELPPSPLGFERLETVMDDAPAQRSDHPAQALVDAVSAQQDEEGPVRNGDGVDAIRPTVERAAPSAERGPVLPPTPTPETAPDRALAQQVSRAIVQQTVDGQRVLQLRLTPPELGTVRIELIEHRGVLQVRLGAEDDGVRAALERALPGLRQDLRAANAPVAGLDLVDQHLEFFQHHHGQGDTHQADEHDRPGSGSHGQRFALDGTTDDNDAPRRTTRDLHARISDDAVDALA